MSKPQRKRIPLRTDRKTGSTGSDARAYTSNYGDSKPPRAKGDFGDNPESFFRKKDAGQSPDRPSKPYGARDFKGKEGSFKKPYSGRPENNAGGSERKERKPFEKREGGEGRPYGKRNSFGDKKPFRSREDGERRPFSGENSGERKPYGDKKPFRNREDGDQKFFGEKKPFSDRKPFSRSDSGDRPSYGDRKPFGDKKPFTPREDGEKRPFSKDKFSGERKPYGDRKPFGEKKPSEKRGNDRRDGSGYRERTASDREYAGSPRRRTFHNEGEKPAPKVAESTEMPLNKYLAHSGISGRREAGELVKAGKVTVNKEVNTNPAYRVQPGDVIAYEGRVVKPEPAKVYVLLNKPKGFITTTEDEADRKTVMDLVQNVEAERLYPVGRLDRNTTGVLLITNDGDLAQRLTHPKYECKKIYQVTLDKDLTKADFEKIATGITLEDGEIKADAVAYLETKNEIGIEIHSGRNRIVRRIFEHLGYSVEKLDRVMFAGLTKKNVPRGKYRLLTDKEVILLKHFKG